MEQKLLTEFERNNYFYGKLLSADDFQNEQNYYINKGKLLKRLFFSGGVVCGMRVTTVEDEDTTVLVEPGIAYDYQGNEIIINSSIRFSLTIEQLKQKKNTYIYLCLEYLEQKEQKTHALNQTPEMEVYNRTKELHRLYWTDCEYSPANLFSEFWDKQVIYAGQEYIITQSVPKYSQNMNKITIIIQVTKFKSDFNITPRDYMLISEYIENGSFQVRLSEMEYTKDVNTFYLAVPIINTNADHISIKGEDTNQWNIKWIKGSVEEYIQNHFYEISTYDLLKNNYPIYLARIHIKNESDVWGINKIENMPFEQYIEGADIKNLLHNIRDSTGYRYQKGIEHISFSYDYTKIKETIDKQYNDLYIQWGTIELLNNTVEALINIGYLEPDDQITMHKILVKSDLEDEKKAIETIISHNYAEEQELYQLKFSDFWVYSKKIKHGLGSGEIDLKLKLIYDCNKNKLKKTVHTPVQLKAVLDNESGDFIIGCLFQECKLEEMSTVIEWEVKLKEETIRTGLEEN